KSKQPGAKAGSVLKRQYGGKQFQEDLLSNVLRCFRVTRHVISEAMYFVFVRFVNLFQGRRISSFTCFDQIPFITERHNHILGRSEVEFSSLISFPSKARNLTCGSFDKYTVITDTGCICHREG